MRCPRGMTSSASSFLVRRCTLLASLPEADSLDTQSKMWGARALHTPCKAVYDMAGGQQGPLWGGM